MRFQTEFIGYISIPRLLIKANSVPKLSVTTTHRHFFLSFIYLPNRDPRPEATNLSGALSADLSNFHFLNAESKLSGDTSRLLLYQLSTSYPADIALFNYSVSFSSISRMFLPCLSMVAGAAIKLVENNRAKVISAVRGIFYPNVGPFYQNIM